MKQTFQEFDPSTIRFAGGKAVPVSRVIAMYQREIATLAAMDGDFRSIVKSVFPGRVASKLELANVTTVMMRHRDARVRAAGARGLLQLADAGINIARYNVALQHLSGEHRVPDFQKAIHLLTAVADTKHADPYLTGLALKGLGDCYVDARGVTADAAKGHRLYEDAAEYGVAGAAFNVGLYHDNKDFNSHPGPVDYPKAAAFYMKAVDLGYVPAMTTLGLLYVAGHVKEPAADYGWGLLSRAAALGDDVAVHAIAVMAAAHVPPRRCGLSAIAATRL
jgi:TPR repeat protein